MAQGLDSEETKNVYLHHVDNFEMNALKKRLMEHNFEENWSKYELFASLLKPENVVKVMHDRHPLEIFNPAYDNYVQKIINCDYILFNIGYPDFECVCEDARKVLNALEAWCDELKKEQDSLTAQQPKKYLILISTPMTWALTNNINTNNGEEEDLEIDLLYEDDYRRRKAHRMYCKHKLLERDVIWFQKKCKPFVRTVVVCPGVTYGAENVKLHYIFKLSFYNKLVPILRPGSQYIPLIYIKDFAEIIKDIIDEFPEAKVRFIFAAQSNFIQLKSFTYRLCKIFNGNCSKVRFMRDVEMLRMDKELFSQDILDILSLNVKLAPTYLKKFKFTEMNDKFYEMLAQEFREARNLHPLKIVLDGPPLVGKTEHAQKLKQYYYLLYVYINEIISTYIKHLEEKINDSIIVIETFECPEQILMDDGEEELEPEALESIVERQLERQKTDTSLRGDEASHKFDTEDEDLIEELKLNVEKWSKELFRLKVYIASHKIFDEQDFDIVSHCLVALLSTKQYNINQGYIIDGFPFSYDQANQIFYNTRRTDEEILEHNDPINPIPPLRPTHFVMFDASDQLLCQRGMSFTETEAIIRRCLRHQMIPRLDKYRERNEEPTCLANIFYDNELIPISIFVDDRTVLIDTVRMIKMEIGTPFVYPLSAAQQKALNEKIAEDRLKDEKEARRKKEELEQKLTLEREKKLLTWTAKYEEIRRHETEMREVKTLPLRQYLGKYVLPTLTEGILKVAELKPDDPIDFLAEYLFKCNPQGQQMPPFCTDEQKSRFLDTFLEDLASSSDYNIDRTRLDRRPSCEGDGK